MRLASRNCKLILSARNIKALEDVKSKCSTAEVVNLLICLNDFDDAKIM
jgi:short-subunit dehydrogenase